MGEQQLRSGHLIMWGELANVLRVMHCGIDEGGRFIVGGNIVSFMGAGEEYVIGPDAVYYVAGEPRNLASAISGTSYSRPVVVI